MTLAGDIELNSNILANSKPKMRIFCGVNRDPDEYV